MSKVIFKLTFKHPNFKDTVSKNMAHVDYIASRPGVDKSLTESDLKKELNKGIEQAMSDDETYIKYINERPQSHGLFGQDGIEDPEQVKEEIANHESYVWRGVVSLKEEDAKELGYIAKDKWQNMVRLKVLDMAKEMGIRIENFRWVGAVHMAKGHPHVHLMIWEKEPEKTIGIISKKAIENIHKLYTDEVFKDEKFLLNNEKTAMRDLIRDIAQGDMGQATRLLMEVKETGVEIRALISEENKIDLPPNMPTQVELELAEKVKQLAGIMPGKGRANLKFMPEDVKAEVRATADYLLNLEQYKPAMERYLKAVEDNNKLYTGQDEALQKSRENAYNDIRDRVSQVILKAAVESQKDNLFYVDKDLADKAVETIKGITNQINLLPEREKVFRQVILSLIKTGHDDEQISKHLIDYSMKENLNYSNQAIREFINDVRKDVSADQELNTLSSSKKMDLYLSSLKLAGYSESEAFSLIHKAIKNDSEELEKQLRGLKTDGLLKMEDGNFKLTNKGIEELLKVKTLDNVQKEIMLSLEEEPGSFKTLYENKDVYSNIYNKDPGEIKISKFDLKVREEFGEENRITFKKLEENIYERYTTADITDADRAEKEIDILKNRIEKLCINGYVEFNKETGIYLFTDEALNLLENLNDKMEFTRYDANVTLSYLDGAEGGTLSSKSLDKKLHSEIVNKAALNAYEKYSEMIEKGQGKEFIKIDDKGNIIATEEGKQLSYELNQINTYFSKSKGNLNEDKLKKICEDDFNKTHEQINTLVSQGFIHNDKGMYVLTEKGVEEYLKVKDLDSVQYNILKSINNGEANALDNILGKEDILNKLYNKDPEEFKLSRYDYKVSEEFGDANKLKFTDLKNSVDERYDLEVPEDIEKAQKEFDLIKGRIEKLALNGYVIYDNDSDIYSFTSEALNELKGLGKDLEFGRYDATTTMSYIDRAENGILKLKDLEAILYREVVNKEANRCYESFGAIQEHEEASKYINVDSNGFITSTKYCKSLSYELNKVQKYFFKANGLLDDDKLMALCKKEFGNNNLDENIKKVMEEINKQVESGNILKGEDGTYRIDPFKADISRLSYQLYKAGGSIHVDSLKETLKANIPNNEAKKQFQYLQKRLEFLKGEGYVSGEPNEYKITLKGEDQRKDILTPQRVFLKNEMRYLENLGFVVSTPQGYETTQKYNEYITKLENPDSKDEIKSSFYINRQVSSLIAKSLDKIDLSKFEPTEKKLNGIMNRIKVQVKRENVLPYKDGSYSIEPFKSDVRSFISQIHKEEDSIQKDKLKEVLEKNIPNYEADNQYKYLIKRLDFLKSEGYLSGVDGKYKLTDLGAEKRDDLIHPERDLLRKEIKYLTRLGFIDQTDEGLKATENYHKYMRDIATAKEKDIERSSHYFSKGITNLIDKTTDNVNVGKIERTNQRFATGKYINDEYKDIKTTYQDVRAACNVPDITAKTLNNLTTTLLAAGMGLEETKQILQQWNVRSSSNIEPEKLNEIIDKAFKNFEEKNLWGKISVVSSKDWNDMFKALGVEEPPQWIYKGENWKNLIHGGVGLASIINDIWKSAWRQFERERMQQEAQAEMMKKHSIKQQAITQNKEARVEQYRKSKDKSSLARDDELDRVGGG